MDFSPSNAPETSSNGPLLEGGAARTTSADRELESSRKSARRRWRQWYSGLLVALIAGSCLHWFRVPILQGVAGYLVVDDPAAADYAILLGRSDRCFDRAERLYHSSSIRGVLLLELRPDRLERMGFLRPLPWLSSCNSSRIAP
jgi:hypothetical protein